MCFYFSINKPKPDSLVKAGVIAREQALSIQPNILVNGFQRPKTPVVSSFNPNIIELFQWGLVPSSIVSTEQAIQFVKSYNTLNAVSESIASSKTYRGPAQNQHCLILASGFFEWQHVRGNRIPYYISLECESLFAFAGIWDQWTDGDGNQHYTYSILTTEANEIMSTIHNTKKRMPVILPFEQSKEWLQWSTEAKRIPDYIKSLTQPQLKAHTVKQFLPIRAGFEPDSSLLNPYNHPTADGNNQLIINF